MNLRFKLLWLLSLAFLQGFSQSNSILTRNIVNIPAPPNVASFIKTADVPVSNYNGTGQISIPLYTIEEGDLKIPISLSYYSNGLKVTEESSWVGLGWNLNVGGVIHQNIVGMPDELQFNGFGKVPFPKKMLPNTNDSVLRTNKIQKGYIYSDKDFNTVAFGTNAETELTNHASNHEYDLFLYNFGGYSGKFIMPNAPYSHEVVTLDKNNIQIITNGAYVDGSFKAITPDGTTYIFKTVGRTFSSTQDGCGLSPQSPSTTSYSYYLTQVITPTGRIANFFYKTYVSNSLPTLSQSYSRTTIGGICSYPQSQGFSTDWAVMYNSASNSFSDHTTVGTSQVENLVLDYIQTSNFTVKFNTSSRDDVDQGVKLDNLSVYRTGEQNAFKSFQFSFDYFYGTGSFGDWTTDPSVVPDCTLPNPPSLALKSERLKLNMIQFKGIGGAAEPPYQFLYNSQLLPFKTSMSQDLWGFLNGYGSHSLLPDYNNLGYFDNHVPVNIGTMTNKVLGIRRANPRYLTAGILEKVINPTGSYTKIVYEPNHFENFPELNTKIIDSVVGVRDDPGPGNKQLEFDVPDINYVTTSPPNGNFASYNPSVINIDLINDYGCNVVPGYNSYTSPYNQESFYALLEKYDSSTGTWSHTEDNVFDVNNINMHNTQGSPCQGINISKLLVPGHYRITANTPDSQNRGWAAISVSFKDFRAVSYPNYGGGLRVKSVTTYKDVNTLLNQKLYTYYSGKLMTKPVFYRNFFSLDAEHVAYAFRDEASQHSLFASCQANCDGCAVSSLELPTAIMALYSNPLINYSYSASGSAIGYDSVMVDYSIGKENGRTVYKYINKPDSSTYNPNLPPGIPGASYLFNGSLISTKELLRNQDGTFSPIKIDSTTFAVTNFQDYWGYKSEYLPPLAACLASTGGSAEPNPQNGYDMEYNFMYFYPVKAGNVHPVKKVTTLYNAAKPYTETITYQYNSKNQVSLQTDQKSDGRLMTKQTYYPPDYATTSSILQQMNGLNMIDYPIEEIQGISDKGIIHTYTANYNEYSYHDNMITPVNLYTLKTATPIIITPSAPNNVKDSHYELRESYTYNAYGSQIQEARVNGVNSNYIWDYLHCFPTAKITNAVSNDFAYTSFEADEQGNWSYTGNIVADPTSPTGTKCYDMSSGDITSPAINGGKVYELSYWTTNSGPYDIGGTLTNFPILRRKIGLWSNYVHKITGQNSVKITGTGNIDDVKIFPDDAVMETYTYDPYVGLSSSTDSKGKISYYVYDQLQRLNNIYDLDHNLTKSFDYNYGGYNYFVNTPLGNNLLTQVFTKNDCPDGFLGTTVTYTVQPNSYVSYLTQAAADNLALDDLKDNGQRTVNSIGSCVIAPCYAPQITVSQTGGTGYSIAYTSSGSAAAVFVAITDITNGNAVNNIPQASVAGGTTTGVVPTPGHQYTFFLEAFGKNCPTGIQSNSVTVQF
jgi:hypothetical protein